MMYPVAILAGGLATRLRPITEKIPKALVSVNGVPFIDYQLAYLNRQGVRDVVLCLGYLGEMIEAYVGDGSNYNLNVKYSYDGEYYLGTGGAIKKALSLLGKDFFVLYGDSFLPVDFANIQNKYQELKALALMSVLKNENQWDKSNVKFIAQDKVEYNKLAPSADMSFIDYGLLVFSLDVFHDIPIEKNIDLAVILNNLSKKNHLYGIEVFERFYEIGSFQGIQEMEEFLIKRKKNELCTTTSK